MSLFNKAAVFTDIHFGAQSDTERHNRDCLDFIDWFSQQAIENKADTIIVMGDVMENQKTTNTHTAWYANEGFRRLNDLGLPIWVLLGNHDIYFRERRDVHALQFVEKFKNVTLIDKPTWADDVLLCPWLLNDEYAWVIEQKAKYIFGHFELPTFLLNDMYEARDRGGLHMDLFWNTEMVFSGHFHKRQAKINQNNIPIIYVGNPFGTRFSDVNDPDRGMMIMERDQDPVFLNWTDGPNYHRLLMSELFDLMETGGVQQRFNAKSVVECTNDLNIPHNDSLEIREAMQEMVRSFYLLDGDADVSMTEEAETVDTQRTMTVSETVTNQLMLVDTEGSKYNREILIKLWESSDK